MPGKGWAETSDMVLVRECTTSCSADTGKSPGALEVTKIEFSLTCHSLKGLVGWAIPLGVLVFTYIGLIIMLHSVARIRHDMYNSSDPYLVKISVFLISIC